MKTLWLSLLALLLAAASPVMAEGKLFEDRTPMQIVISAPFSKIVSGRRANTNPYAATLTVTEGDGAPQTVPVQIRARGLTRRTGDYCAFPPLSLEFEKGAAHGTPFHGQRKLKLVTYCRDAGDYEQRIILESLAYRLYNVITPLSFRIRGATVTYREGAKGGVTRYGFLIENIDDVAERNHRAELKATYSKQVAVTQLDPRATARAAMLELLVGNLDFDFLADAPGQGCCHNSRFLAAPGATPANATAVVPLPYDFDYSGLVNAPYAVVPEGLHVTKITDRLYRGYCISSGEIASVVDEYRAHRAELMAVVAAEPRLNDGFRAKATRYLEGFFDLLDDPSRLQKEILGKCRQGR